MPSRSAPRPQEEGAFHISYCLRTHRHRNRHALKRPLPLLLPTPTTATKVRVRGRERGKARTMALVAPATTAATTTGTPWCGPPSIIPGSAPSQCSQGCVLRSSSQCVHHSTPCLLHQCTTRLPVAPPSCPCRCLRRTSSRLQPLPSRPGWAHGIDNHWPTPSAPWHWLSRLSPTGSWTLAPPTNTTSDVGNLTSVRPPTSTDPASIIIGNGSALLVTSVGDLALPDLFYLNNVLVTPDIIQNLLSVHCFTTNNWCSMKFDLFGFSVKDLSTRNMITRCNSSGPLYTMRLPSHPAHSSPASTPSALVASASTWHRRLDHPGVDVLSKLCHDSSVICSSHTHDLYHACQLGRHIHLPFVSSNTRVDNNFDLIYCDLWSTPDVSVSSYKYSLVILDDHSHFVCTFPLRVKSDTFSTLSKKFAYVSTQFGRTIKAVQCDNDHEFDSVSSRAFFATKGVLLQMSCRNTSP
jgi:hypothetical protein